MEQYTTIPYLLQYIIPAALAFLVGFMLWQLKRERFKLDYDIIKSGSFPLKEEIGKFFVCELKNKGNRAIEDIDFDIRIARGNIHSVQYVNVHLLNSIEQHEHIIKGRIPFLNPEEKTGAIITTSHFDNDSEIEVAARAIGVTATKADNNQLSLSQQISAFVFLLMISGVLGSANK